MKCPFQEYETRTQFMVTTIHSLNTILLLKHKKQLWTFLSWYSHTYEKG